MILFLIAAVPVFYLAMDSLISDLHGRIDDSYKPFAYGFICFVAALVIYNIIRLMFLTPVYTPSGIYIYYLLHDSLIPFALAVTGYLLVFGFTDFETGHHAVNRMFAFMCGFYCFWSINDLIINFGWYNNHLLLIIPIQRIGLIAAFSLLFSEALKRRGASRVLLYVLTGLLPFITAAGSMLWRLSYTIPMIGVTAGLPVLSGIFLYRKLRPVSEKPKVSLTSE
ncbi:MAG: hypothetical protein PQJ61_08035 [Spirochaetales bacterium]|uniref:Uncharacterized protein n=1 Tax=Candidatus Thalassospirochaeta sargassi TaxID=3119039 RepID=A0AAJ1MMI2_9SPIO|nr:hypothetical protein [Spirochaetales bacterium]